LPKITAQVLQHYRNRAFKSVAAKPPEASGFSDHRQVHFLAFDYGQAIFLVFPS
jgi:hypothetical protein